MLLLDRIAEERIAAAMSRGELSNLPGEGRPLDLDDDRLIPDALRLAYRILKNAGFLPPEVECLREIGELERMLETLAIGERRSLALRKLQLLRVRLDSTAHRSRRLRGKAGYTAHILKRLEMNAEHT